MTLFDGDRLVFLGVDPGITGAVGFLNYKGPYEVIDFKDTEKALDYLREMHYNGFGLFGAIEQVHALPRQSVPSGTKFMKNAGWWAGVFDAFKVQWVNPVPRLWQGRILGDHSTILDPQGNKDWKAMSLRSARIRFPELKNKLSLKKHHNRADALNLALYARLHFIGD